VREALAARADLPRPLSAEEEAVLRFAVEHSGSRDREALMAQIPSARVRGYCGCGCATVDLLIEDPDVPRARDGHPPFGEVAVLDEKGAIVGSVSIFVVAGLLHTIELVDNGDGPISPMPPIERLRRRSPR
jgi:hypothetical protein